jgi:N-acetylmuramoyl-L-alanine amidase
MATLSLSGCGIAELSAPSKSPDDQFLALFETDNARLANDKLPHSTKEINQKLQSSQPGRSITTLDNAIQCIERLDDSPIEMQKADPTNYGKRVSVDKSGNPVHSRPLFVVFHETVSSEEKTLNYFRTPHLNDADQASYHMLISRNGKRIRIVDDTLRAFGAGQSSFRNFTVKLSPEGAGSLNNVALHIGLVSPTDGQGDDDNHSGYTNEQYRSLALQTLSWQLRHQIPSNRITTHKAIDQSGTRRDPRSFDWPQFNKIWKTYAQQCNALSYTQDERMSDSTRSNH